VLKWRSSHLSSGPRQRGTPSPDVQRSAQGARTATRRLLQSAFGACPAIHTNAVRTQLVREGCVHNYMRMLWGKKILEWSASSQDALETMIELNNKYALDGRDPNSYNGIFWILGRYDRPWGPERPVYGTVRYMSSESTLKKTHARGYVRRYSP